MSRLLRMLPLRVLWPVLLLLAAFVIFFEFIADVGGSRDPLPSPPSARPVPTVVTEQLASATPVATPTPTPAPAATPTATPEAPPVAGVTPVVEFEVTVISPEVPANVRQAPTTEAGLVGVIPLGIKATVVGEVVGEEAFAGSEIRTWYLVKAIPPDLPEDGFVYSAVVVR